MPYEHCPQCYDDTRETSFPEFNTLRQTDEYTLVCDACGSEFTNTEFMNYWSSLEQIERMNEEIRKEQLEAETALMQSGEMNEYGEFVDEDGDLLYPDEWSVDD